MWKFSTAKLESRGKRMKAIWRKKTSGRPRQVGENKVQKRKQTRGGAMSKKNKRAKNENFYTTKGHNNVQCRAALAFVTIREKQKLSQTATGAARRDREQLINLGKIDRLHCVKTEFNVPERWSELVPPSVDFTVEGLLKAMVTGVIKPLYDIEGKRACE